MQREDKGKKAAGPLGQKDRAAAAPPLGRFKQGRFLSSSLPVRSVSDRSLSLSPSPAVVHLAPFHGVLDYYLSLDAIQPRFESKPMGI